MRSTRFLILTYLSALLLGCGSGEDGFSSGSGGGGTGGGGSTESSGGQAVGYAGVTLESHFTITDSIDQPKSLQISGDGNTIVFVSDKDLTGNNTDNVNQVFSISGGTLTQITNFDATTGGTNSVPSGYPNSQFSLSRDGTTLAWIAANDPLGTNADGSTEIFISDLLGNITQLTNTATSTISNIDISSDGSLVAFSSTADLIGSNAGNDLQLYTIETAAPNTITQVTNNTVGTFIRSMELTGDGNVIMFSSFEDWLGANPTSNYQVFTVNTNGSNFTQLTTAASDHQTPKINDDGSVIVFNSQGDLTGNNADGSSEIFLLVTATTTITQLTTDRSVHTANSVLGRDFYDVSGDGQVLVYVEDVSGSITLRSINLSSPGTPTTLLLTAAGSTSSSDYFNLPLTSFTGARTAFVSNFDFGLTVTGEISDQIYSFQ